MQTFKKFINLTKFILSFILILILSACAKQTPVIIGDYFQPIAIPPPHGMVNLYVYNPYSQPTNDQPLLYLDGTKVAKFPNTTYTLLQLTPGLHSLGVQNETALGPSEVQQLRPIYLSANLNYYLKYQRSIGVSVTTMPAPGNTYSSYAIPYVKKQNFVLIGDYTKASSIGICRFVTPLTTAVTNKNIYSSRHHP